MVTWQTQVEMKSWEMKEDGGELRSYEVRNWGCLPFGHREGRAQELEGHGEAQQNAPRR